jgi:hypothetical protein
VEELPASIDDFREKYMLPRKPLVFSAATRGVAGLDALMGWHTERWTPDYLRLVRTTTSPGPNAALSVISTRIYTYKSTPRSTLATLMYLLSRRSKMWTSVLARGSGPTSASSSNGSVPWLVY